MRINFTSSVVASLAFCATAAFAANHARVDVPFSFTAKGLTYPAGTYDVSKDISSNFITMTSEADASKHISWGTGPADAAQAPAVVRFDQVGTDHMLKNIQYGVRVTSNLDTPSKRGISATTSIGGQ